MTDIKKQTEIRKKIRICVCGHRKTEHLKYGSRTLDMSSSYRECSVCSCRQYKRDEKL